MTVITNDYLKKMTLNDIENEIIDRNSDITSLIVGFWHKRNEIDEIISHSEDCLNYCKLHYEYRTLLEEIEKPDEDLFSWKNNYVKIWCIGIDSTDIGERRTMFFATVSDKDEFIAINAVKETAVPIFLKSDSMGQIKFLIENNLIPDIKDSLIFNSVNNNHSIQYWVEEWYNSESKNIEKLAAPSRELFDFNKSTIRAKRYNFEEMINTINNEQFTIEFDECLYAYNNEKWFTCASGLGGVLEHLLYLILEKNNMLDKQFPDNATYQNYVAYMARPPISIDKRQKTMIKNVFNIRNSISHFNQGFTSKDQCSFLLSAIKDVFNNYYNKDFSLEER